MFHGNDWCTIQNNRKWLVLLSAKVHWRQNSSDFSSDVFLQTIKTSNGNLMKNSQSFNVKVFITDLDISMTENVQVQICSDNLLPIILTTVLWNKVYFRNWHKCAWNFTEQNYKPAVLGCRNADMNIFLLDVRILTLSMHLLKASKAFHLKILVLIWPFPSTIKSITIYDFTIFHRPYLFPPTKTE